MSLLRPSQRPKGQRLSSAATGRRTSAAGHVCACLGGLYSCRHPVGIVDEFDIRGSGTDPSSSDAVCRCEFASVSGVFRASVRQGWLPALNGQRAQFTASQSRISLSWKYEQSPVLSGDIGLCPAPRETAAVRWPPVRWGFSAWVTSLGWEAACGNLAVRIFCRCSVPAKVSRPSVCAGGRFLCFS